MGEREGRSDWEMNEMNEMNEMTEMDEKNPPVVIWCPN